MLRLRVGDTVKIVNKEYIIAFNFCTSQQISNFQCGEGDMFTVLAVDCVLPANNFFASTQRKSNNVILTNNSAEGTIIFANHQAAQRIGCSSCNNCSSIGRGDTVSVTDGSYSLTINGDKMVHKMGSELKDRMYRVLSVECSMPGHGTEMKNDVIIREMMPDGTKGSVTFIMKRFLSLEWRTCSACGYKKHFNNR